MIIIIMLYASVHIHTCIHAYTHTYIHTYIHTKNTYIHTYIHTYIIVSSCLAAENLKDTYRMGGGDRGCGKFTALKEQLLLLPVCRLSPSSTYLEAGISGGALRPTWTDLEAGITANAHANCTQNVYKYKYKRTCELHQERIMT